MKNKKTTLGYILTAITLVPQAIESIGLAEVPNWLRITGLACAFVSFIYTGVVSADAESEK